jgi:hypothetical protein
MIITYILSAFIILAVYLVSLGLPGARRVPENFAFAFWGCLAISLTILLMRPAYSLWLSLDFWIDPWQPGEPK